MPALHLDPAKTNLVLAADTADPAKQYAQLNDGSTRATGQQATHPDTGMPLWIVMCLLVATEPGSKPEMVRVKVESPDRPILGSLFQPVSFDGLTCTPYVDSQSGRVALSFRATGIRQAAVKAA